MQPIDIASCPEHNTRLMIPFDFFRELLFDVERFHLERQNLRVIRHMPIGHAKCAFQELVDYAISSLCSYCTGDISKMMYYLYRHYPALTDPQVMEDFMDEVIEANVSKLTTYIENSFLLPDLEWRTWNIHVEEGGTDAIILECLMDYRILQWNKAQSKNKSYVDANYTHPVCYSNGRV